MHKPDQQAVVAPETGCGTPPSLSTAPAIIFPVYLPKIDKITPPWGSLHSLPTYLVPTYTYLGYLGSWQLGVDIESKSLFATSLDSYALLTSPPPISLNLRDLLLL